MFEAEIKHSIHWVSIAAGVYFILLLGSGYRVSKRGATFGKPKQKTNQVFFYIHMCIYTYILLGITWDDGRRMKI